MAKKKKNQIEEAYWEFLLEHGRSPASVFKFCKDHDWKEEEFYKHFSSFEAVERSFWKGTVAQTTKTLNEDAEVQKYDPRQRLLAFYYTFFEQALVVRSRFLLRFPKGVCPAGSAISGMQREFEDFARHLVDEAVEADLLLSNKRIVRVFPKALWAQFRFLIEFYCRDQSEAFQDTDALIEKSVRFFFDSAKFPVLDSGVDLARFLLPRMSFS